MKRHKARSTSPIKYYQQNQIKLLRRTVKERAELAIKKNKKTAIKEWVVVDLLTSTGVRVAEVVDLRCCDIDCGYGKSSIFIRNGKSSKSRVIQVPASLKANLNKFMRWKKIQGEDIAGDAYVFMGQRGPMKSQAIQGIVKKYLKLLDLYQQGKSVHSLRHSYAVHLYRREKDIRAVQQQLGHCNIQTTMIYAGVLDEDIQ